MGGHTAKVARDELEKNLGENVVSKDNALLYDYAEDDLIDYYTYQIKACIITAFARNQFVDLQPYHFIKTIWKQTLNYSHL